jgi:uncharacterized protein YjbI with pentapeptide repeats
MADDGGQQRKPDFRTAVEDVKALATVLIVEAESVLGRRLNLRSPAVLAAIGVVVTIVLAVGVVLALLRTGDANAVSDNAPLIAAVIALGGVGTAQMVSIALEDRRTQEARDLEERRAQEDSLQDYFKHMGDLLTEHELMGTEQADDPVDDPVRVLARAQTLTLLERLGSKRDRAMRNKRVLVLFLYSMGLINKDNTIVQLVGANLSASDLSSTNLNDANFRDANLVGANFDGAYLVGAYLAGANFDGADLSGTDLGAANCTSANFRDADLSGAYLGSAYLVGTDFGSAYLIGANLINADLIGADLSGALLSGALLGGAKVTEEQLSSCSSLEGATMPDGQILRSADNPDRPTFAEWLKRKGREEDGENSRPS